MIEKDCMKNLFIGAQIELRYHIGIYWQRAWMSRDVLKPLAVFEEECCFLVELIQQKRLVTSVGEQRAKRAL